MTVISAYSITDQRGKMSGWEMSRRKCPDTWCFICKCRQAFAYVLWLVCCLQLISECQRRVLVQSRREARSLEHPIGIHFSVH